MNIRSFVFAPLFALATLAHAGQYVAEIYKTDGNKSPMGTIVFEDSPYGLLIKTHLNGLFPGSHGLHLHQHPSCDEAGMAAGGHFDPKKTNTHLGPFGKGHLGDLPVLVVDATGTSDTITLAPRLKTKDLKGLSVMVHAGGDHYTDTPPLGGGGERVACGIVQMKKK